MSSIATMISAADRLEACAKIPWHRHREPYIAVIADGCLEEVGEHGRTTLTAGEFIIHEAFEAHADDAGDAGVEIINLPLPSNFDAASASGAADIEDLLRKITQDGADAAAQWLLGSATRTQRRKTDWPDALAADLSADFALSIVQWAEQRGMAPETVSRGFRRAYGITPKSFRAIVRARKAAAALQRTRAPLVQVALEFGYSDQSHFCRAITEVTGVSPARWRRSTGYNSC